MKNYISLFAFTLLGSSCFGQHHFERKDASMKYDVMINVEDCFSDQCKGKAIIELFNKKTKKTQSLTSKDLVFMINENQKSESGSIIQLNAKQIPLIFDDFNFDGTEDVAVRNGNMGNYSSASYDVYVFNTSKKEFVQSKELTELASTGMDMFDRDPKRKRLITYGKSGCCTLYTTEYSIIPNKGLDKVFEKIEDRSGEEKVKVTTKEKINNKWVTKKKDYSIEQYYKGKLK